MKIHHVRPRGVTAIAIVNGVAAAITLTFWLVVQQRLFKDGNLDRASVASTLGFMVADIIWAVPMLIISVPGLWRFQAWGWATAQLANILWMYPLTAAWTRDLYLGSISPGNLLFLPFALFSVWAAYYLWQTRYLFWRESSAVQK